MAFRHFLVKAESRHFPPFRLFHDLDGLQEETFYWNLNLAIMLMTIFLNVNSVHNKSDSPM
mgnify:CR=1 FL=1